MSVFHLFRLFRISKLLLLSLPSSLCNQLQIVSLHSFSRFDMNPSIPSDPGRMPSQASGLRHLPRIMHQSEWCWSIPLAAGWTRNNSIPLPGRLTNYLSRYSIFANHGHIAILFLLCCYLVRGSVVVAVKAKIAARLTGVEENG